MIAMNANSSATVLDSPASRIASVFSLELPAAV
jgi:hypothetical protein